MKMKGEAKLLHTWMQKSKRLGKELPKASTGSDHVVEQLNLKVPEGTKLRLKRLGLEQGGLSMLTVFKRMLDEYEARHHEKKKS